MTPVTANFWLPSLPVHRETARAVLRAVPGHRRLGGRRDAQPASAAPTSNSSRYWSARPVRTAGTHASRRRRRRDRTPDPRLQPAGRLPDPAAIRAPRSTAGPQPAAARIGPLLCRHRDPRPSGSGPSRRTGAQRDFIDLVLNVGQPPDKELGGGSFGYGKAAFYLASRARTVVIDSLCETGAAVGSNCSTPLSRAVSARTYSDPTGRPFNGQPPVGSDR